MSKGYIKLYRQLTLNKEYKNSAYVHLWLHLLLRASHTGSLWRFKNRDYKIKTGQILCSFKGLAEQTGINYMKCYRIVKKLESQKMISKRTYNKCSVITILNWRKYQGELKKDNVNFLKYDYSEYKPLQPVKKFLA